MSYIALYRKYRPKDFTQIAGQSVIVKTLENAVLNNKIAHAYLFSGPRGTGKTSVAKIFAKAINCTSTDNHKPCGVCDVCQAIENNQIADVIEIDAASNNGVDEIRELRDKVKYMPQLAKYKVYIIDEVHMLSTGAFNALLKTLEEPPKHVVFILATTETHKIPATILSRCQRFDFKNIEEQDIVDKLNEIVKAENIKATPVALKAIAKHAEGGMRDALSLLDQCVSFAKDEVNDEVVYQVSGSLSYQHIKEIFEAIVDKNTEKALMVIDELFSEGKEASRIVSDLVLGLRDLLLDKKTNNSASHYESLKSSYKLEKIYYDLDILTKLANDLKFTQQKRAFIELALIKMMHHKEALYIDQLALINDLLKRIENLEQNGVKNNNQIIVDSNAFAKEPLVTIKDIEDILHEGDRAKRDELTAHWHLFENYDVVDLRLTARMLYNSELVAVSDKAIFACDDLTTCEALMSEEIKKQALKIINKKKIHFKDYVAILKSDWQKLQNIYLDQWKQGNKKPKLPYVDLKLYKKQNEETTIEKEKDLLEIAKEYFGDIVEEKE